MTDFIPGMELSELFFHEAVRPLIDTEFPELEYSAGLIGHNSEVLGFDTPMSTDHSWGPRVQLFIDPADHEEKQTISESLGRRLPREFRGYSTHFSDIIAGATRLLQPAPIDGPINHMVEIHTIDSFLAGYLGLKNHRSMTVAIWLTLSEQKLATIRSGKVFRDQVGLNEVRGRLHYYPRDIWLYLLAAEWKKIGQEEPFVGRTGDVGDELGSRVIAARLVNAVMRLGFLMEQVYAPYSKWFGTAFSRLKCSIELSPVLGAVLAAVDWHERENQLSAAYGIIARLHNQLGITKNMPTAVSQFHDRPFQVIHGDDFAAEIKRQITDPEVANIASLIGSVNQFSANVDLLESNELLSSLRALYM
jgi:hypothetical protein